MTATVGVELCGTSFKDALLGLYASPHKDVVTGTHARTSSGRHAPKRLEPNGYGQTCPNPFP